MARWAGIDQQGSIRIVSSSDQTFTCSDYQVVLVPAELEHEVDKELMLNYRYRGNEFYSKKNSKDASKQRVALVSNYGTQCGIGIYSKYLYDELCPMIGDYKLFIEKNEVFEIENPTIPMEKIVPCWKRGESLAELVVAIKEYDPDVIMLQHEFGLWSSAKHFLSMMTQLSEYRIITTMHSVFHHQDKTICEAAMPEIIVHLEGAKRVLKEKGISSIIHTIPHGCYEFNEQRLWNFYRSQHTILQCGFGFAYKNFSDSIRACGLLKEKYSDVFLTMIFSESDFNKLGHQLYYNELIKLIEELGLQENCGIIRGFQSEKVISSYLRTNKVAVFPYKSEPGHECWGSSGACRLAFSANMPVITSKVPHFIDTPSIKVETPEEMAQQLDKLFSNEKHFKAQLVKQKDFVLANSWKITAEKYVSILERLDR